MTGHQLARMADLRSRGVWNLDETAEWLELVAGCDHRYPDGERSWKVRLSFHDSFEVSQCPFCRQVPSGEHIRRFVVEQVASKWKYGSTP